MISLNFKNFLVESIVEEEKNNLRTIIQKLIGNDHAWIEEHGIDAKDKGNYWIINYKQDAKTDAYNQLVRGMVVEKPTHPVADNLNLIKSFPMKRFFNQHEGSAAVFDLSQSEMIEKLDGCFVGVFFPGQNPHDPHWHTRKMLSDHGPDRQHTLTTFHGKQYNLLELIGQYVHKINFNKQDVKFTYVFEFLHDATKVVTKYTPDQFGLYLLAARSLEDFKELSEKELDETAKRLGVRRPRRWEAIADKDQIAKFMKEIGGDSNFEGFVFRHKDSGGRVKVKDVDYVKIHHMIDSLSFKNLLPKVLEGETDEILAYFPHAKEKIEEIQEKFNKYVDHVTERIRYWKSKNMPKAELAQIILGRDAKRWDAKTGNNAVSKIPPAEHDRWLGGKVLSYINLEDDLIRKQVKQDLIKLAVGIEVTGREGLTHTNANPKKVIELIGLNDDEENTDTEL